MLRNIIKIGAISFNVVAVLMLLLSASAQFLSPEKFHFSAYLAMAFLPLVFVNVLFILFWIAHLKTYFLLSFLCLLLLHNNVRASISIIKTGNKKEIAGKDIRVMTYNIMLFNYYQQDSKILNYLANSDADILCLQEFGWHRNGRDFMSKEKIMTTLGKNFLYSHINITLNRNGVTYGIATFSRFPIVNKGVVEYESHFNSSIYSDIKIGNDTIRVFNNHLESNRLTEEDKTNLAEKMDAEIVTQMARKLSVAAAIRAKQAEAVAKKVAESPHRVLVCGDFNDVPVSYVYRTMSRNLTDTFIGSGSGLGITYSDNFYRFRIDYILVDRNLSHHSFHISNVKYSDHFPVYCTIRLLTN